MGEPEIPIEIKSEIDPLKQGLTEEDLKNAVITGEIARASCTLNDPNILAGFLAWARTTRALRDLLVLKGWSRNSAGNFETVVSPNGRIAIAVSTGDENTGHLDADANTKYRRGPASAAVLNQNQLALNLIWPDSERNEEVVLERATWILLLKSKAEEVVYELSLPESVDSGGLVKSWAHRYTFPPIPRDDKFAGDRKADDEGDEPDIDIDISRKS